MATFKKATITVKDFKTASYLSCEDCYIARALKRAGARNVSVSDFDYQYSINGKSFWVKITNKLANAVKSSVAFKRTKSFTFKIPVA